MLAKPAEELAKLEAAIELTLKNPSFGIDLGYW